MIAADKAGAKEFQCFIIPHALIWTERIAVGIALISRSNLVYNW
jgi:hypothetical protein